MIEKLNRRHEVVKDKMNMFENSLEHLMAELERIDLLLRLQVMRVRQRNSQSNEDEFRGLYISEEDVAVLMARGLAVDDRADAPTASDSHFTVTLPRLEEEIAFKTAESLAGGVSLKLCELVDEFNLSTFERDTLLICLLSEIDTKYERLYAYLHDDVTKKRPSVNLVLKCLLDSLEQRIEARVKFLPHAPLIKHHLLRVDDDAMSLSPPLLMRSLKIEDRLVSYLLGSNQIDHRLGRYVRLVTPTMSVDDLILTDELRRRLSIPTFEFCESVLLYLEGPYGIGKRTIAEALYQSCGLPLLMVDLPGLLADDMSPETCIELVFVEAKLQRAVLCFQGLDPLLADDRNMKSCLNTLTTNLRNFDRPAIITGEANWLPGSSLADKFFISVEVPLPPYHLREHLWEFYLNSEMPRTADINISEIADKFRFTPGQIKDAVATARNLAVCRGSKDISEAELYSAARAVSSQVLSSLACKIRPRFAWNDIVLPRDQVAQLREICSYVKYRHLVYGEWNFDRKISLGRGLNVLFTGPSGTGKTMAAEIIANELGLDLYKIDLSTVISKYIGETEKNLDRIFTEAQNSNAILFFDEADAVFGKRSEVRDSHDRYANIEVAYLLQKMEEYDGIVILATNLRKNMDEAFARRMHFSVEFPLPEEHDRQEIWKCIFPEEAPLSESVDLGFMARQFKVTGGNIKNMAVGAAFLAADDGGTITIEHLIKAAKREYQKIGRLCTEADFGPYFELVRS